MEALAGGAADGLRASVEERAGAPAEARLRGVRGDGDAALLL